ncbi:MAG: L,D-transpeptidase [Methylocystis sp.]|uniref:L,D-transpeptidase n=1 Tax=Methylocystis sp. TaxID=1911079 RepID=UPI003DA458D9
MIGSGRIAATALSMALGALVTAAPAAAHVSAAQRVAVGRGVIDFASDAQPGTIVISASQRRLFYVVGEGRAISYPVAVPKHGKEWSGVKSIQAKYENPDWTPPADVRADHPDLPDVIPGGSPRNPMGSRAMLLDGDQVAIHGTTARMRASIGSAASYGCIRMLNEDVADLYERVGVGTTVIMQP